VQQVVWRELAAQVPAGVLTIADRMLVEIYCSLVARHRGGDPGPDEEPNPPEVLKSGEYNLIISILSRMGLTPSDRSRVDAPTDPKRRAKDTFAQLASTPRGSHVKQ
jgi:phage terminase small subunit